MKKIVVLGLITALPCFLLAAVPEPFASIVSIPLSQAESNATGKKGKLQRLIESYKPKVAVEIGSNSGDFTIFMAKLMEKQVYYPRVFAIDMWNGDSSSAKISSYHQFLSNCVYHQVTHIVTPIRMSSFEAANALNIAPDLVYIDYFKDRFELQNSILNWYGKMKAGGVICGNQWTYAGMQDIIRETAEILGHDVLIEPPFWSFRQKPRI